MPYWSITVNNNETGTPNNTSLHLYTNNSQRMYIDSYSVYKGIGTAKPVPGCMLQAVFLSETVTTSNAIRALNLADTAAFTNTTTIQYSLPSGYNTAMIVITDKAGRTLKTLAPNGSYSGTLQVNASTLASGAYLYALIVDVSLVNTKRMLRAK